MSFAAFSNGLADLTVTGVTHKQRYMPNTLDSADLPFQFVRLPEGADGGLTADGQGGWPTLVVELVIAVKPIGQSTNEENHAATLTLFDAVDTALRAASGDWFTGKLAWTVRGQQAFIGQNEYWCVVARVTARGR